MKKVLLVLIMFLTMSLIGCSVNESTTNETTTLTSSDITTQTEDPVNSCSFGISLGVSNGVEQIDTEYVLCVASGTGSDNFTADGWCVASAIFMMTPEYEEMPLIEQTDTMSFNKDNNITLGQVEVYNLEQELLETWNSWDEGSVLDSGEYYIILSVSKTESDCNVSGSAVFILKVN